MPQRPRHIDCMSDQPQIFDAGLVRWRMQRAVRHPEFPAFLFERTNAEIEDRLSLVKRTFNETVILTDCPAGLDERLRHSSQHTSVTTAGQSGRSDQIADFELPTLAPESTDCIVSVLNLHAVNDLPGALLRYRRALRPDGLFIGALLGAGSLAELRDAWLSAEAGRPRGASPRVAPFADVRTLGGLLQRAGFALPVADCENLTVTYKDALSAMREVKALGWSNALQSRSRVPVTRTLLAHAAGQYETAARRTGGRVQMSLNIVHVTGWAPHHSQQQPLKPGSANMRLADALKAARK